MPYVEWFTIPVNYLFCQNVLAKTVAALLHRSLTDIWQIPSTKLDLLQIQNRISLDT